MHRIPGIAIFLGAASIAGAGGTRTFELETRAQWAKGKEFTRVALHPDGTLRAAPAAKAVPLEKETAAWCGLATGADAFLVGTASGKILRVRGEKVETEHATGEMLVTSLADVGGQVYAATVPNGRIFRRDAKGAWSLYATLPEKYVWRLVPHDGGLLAVTGPEGKLYRIDAANGTWTVRYDPKQSNILAVLPDPAGDGILFGTANPGLLYRLGVDGKARVLHSFGDAEVHLLRADGRDVIVAVNGGVKETPAAFLGALKSADGSVRQGKDAPAPVQEGPPPGPAEEGEEAPAPRPGVRPGPAGHPAGGVRGEVFRMTPDGRIASVAGFPSGFIADLLPSGGGEVVVATHNSGRIFAVDAAGRTTLRHDFAENQGLALLAREGRLAAVATGDPAVLHRIGAEPAPDGSYESEIVDVGSPATWGAIAWGGEGRLAFRARSGNVPEPDATWSDWSDGAAENPAPIRAPRGRYLQLKIDWKGDAKAWIRTLRASCLPDNRRPRVLEAAIEAFHPQGPRGPQPPPGPDGPTAAPDPLAPHSDQKRIHWRAEDPDGDALAVRLAVRPVGADGPWVPLLQGDPLTTPAPEFVWPTGSVPDGRYVLRVEASDEPANPADRALRAELETEPFFVDNRPPEVRLEAAKGGVRGSAKDAASPIVRIEFQVDGGAWAPAAPKDGILDAPEEAFESELKDLPAGAHAVAVRAVDSEGNIGTAGITISSGR